MHTISVAEDGETTIKTKHVRELTNEALQLLDMPPLVATSDVKVVAPKDADYGIAEDEIKGGIRLIATKEGLIADPVYEGRAIRGLIDLSASGRLASTDKVLLMHLDGPPAIHAYAGQFDDVKLTPLSCE